jgi:hypothetical protein
LAQTALAHAEGARRYGPWNWRSNNVCATTYIGAIKRHMDAWQDGEDFDPDLPGVSHLAKIAACCNILMDAGHCGTLVDDRSKVPRANTEYVDAPVDGIRGFFKDGEFTVTQLGGPDSGFEQHGTPAEPASDEIKEIIPMPRGLPPLPPVPEGFRRWEYRGKGWASNENTYYGYSGVSSPEWIIRSGRSSGDPGHYIEAVK